MYVRCVMHIRVVVNIRDIHVGDARIGDVHAIEITSAHVIPGHVGFAKTQWAPSVAASVAATEADTHAPLRPAEPRDQSRRIVRTHIHWAGGPTPRTAPI